MAEQTSTEQGSQDQSKRLSEETQANQKSPPKAKKSERGSIALSSESSCESEEQVEVVEEKVKKQGKNGGTEEEGPIETAKQKQTRKRVRNDKSQEP